MQKTVIVSAYPHFSGVGEPVTFLTTLWETPPASVNGMLVPLRITEKGVLEEMTFDYELVGGESPHAFIRIMQDSIVWKPLTSVNAVAILEHQPEAPDASCLGTVRVAFREGRIVRSELISQ